MEGKPGWTGNLEKGYVIEHRKNLLGLEGGGNFEGAKVKDRIHNEKKLYPATRKDDDTEEIKIQEGTVRTWGARFSGAA